LDPSALAVFDHPVWFGRPIRYGLTVGKPVLNPFSEGEERFHYHGITFACRFQGDREAWLLSAFLQKDHEENRSHHQTIQAG
jgi:hypothetical protein